MRSSRTFAASAVAAVVIGGVLGIWGVLGLAGCAGGGPGCAADGAPGGTTGAGTDAAAGKPARGGSLAVAIPQDPDGLDPHRTVAAATFEIACNIYDTLVNVDPAGNLIPGLARSWRCSEDGLAWTFELEPQVYFHNGRRMTAQDVVYSFQRLLDPATACPRAKDYQIIDSVTAPRADCVEFRLRAPQAAFLSNLAMGWTAIVPEEAAGDLVAHPVGTGPFRFVEWLPNQRVRLARSDRYFKRGLPYLDEVTFQVIPDAPAQAQSLKAGAVDVVPHLPGELAADIASAPGCRLVTAPANMVQIMAVNNARKPFDDVRVRRAVAWAVDKRAVIDGAVWGYGTVIGSHMPPVSPYYVDLSGRYQPADAARARSLLAEAGLPSGFETVISLPAPYDMHCRAGEVIADQLARAGIQARLEKVEWGSWLENVYSGRRYQLTVIAHTGRLDPDPFLNRYTSGSQENYMNYNNPAYDDLIARAAVMTGAEGRRAAYARLQEMLADDAVALYIQAPHELVGLRAGIGGFNIYPIDIFDLRGVWRARG